MEAPEIGQKNIAKIRDISPEIHESNEMYKNVLNIALDGYKNEMVGRNVKVEESGEIEVRAYGKNGGGIYTDEEIKWDIEGVNEMEEKWRSGIDKGPEAIEKIIPIALMDLSRDFTVRRGNYSKLIFDEFDYTEEERRTFVKHNESVPEYIAAFMASKPDNYFEKIDSWVGAEEILFSFDTTLIRNIRSKAAGKKMENTININIEGGTLLYPYRHDKDGRYVCSTASVANFPHLILTPSRNSITSYFYELNSLLTEGGKLKERNKKRWEKKQEEIYTNIAFTTIDDIIKSLKILSDSSDMHMRAFQDKGYLKRKTGEYLQYIKEKYQFNHILGSDKEAEVAVEQRFKKAEELREKILPCLKQFAAKKLIKLKLEDMNL